MITKCVVRILKKDLLLKEKKENGQTTKSVKILFSKIFLKDQDDYNYFSGSSDIYNILRDMFVGNICIKVYNSHIYTIKIYYY